MVHPKERRAVTIRTSLAQLLPTPTPPPDPPAPSALSPRSLVFPLTNPQRHNARSLLIPIPVLLLLGRNSTEQFFAAADDVLARDLNLTAGCAVWGKMHTGKLLQRVVIGRFSQVSSILLGTRNGVFVKG